MHNLTWIILPFKYCSISLCFRSRVSALSFDGTVSYENLNMDYISTLCGEGFQQSRVIRALGITRGDLGMARDILQEFTQPSSTWKLSNWSVVKPPSDIATYGTKADLEKYRRAPLNLRFTMAYKYILNNIVPSSSYRLIKI